MQAIQSFGARDVRLVSVPDPIIADGQVLVKVLASGICGSDKWLWRNTAPTSAIAGHEIAGEVIALDEQVRRLRLGDRVAINNVGGCGVCPACRAGAFVQCPHWDGSADVNGGFGEMVAAPERNCLKLDDRIDSETGALIFDNFGTPLSALERADVGVGDDVVITGCGPIGLAAVMLARLRGAFVIAVDPLPARRAVAAKLGAHATLSPDADTAPAVRSLTDGLGARVVVECSGKGPSYPIGMDCLRVAGIFVSVGEGAQFDLHPSDALIRRRLTLAGSWYSTMQQGAHLQHMILQGQFDPRVLVSHRAPLRDFPALFQKVCEQPDAVVKAIITG